MGKLLKMVRQPQLSGEVQEQYFFRNLQIIKEDTNPISWALRIEGSNSQCVDDSNPGDITIEALEELYAAGVTELDGSLTKIYAAPAAYDQIVALTHEIGEVG